MKFPEEANCMFICYAQGPEEYQLYVHLLCRGQCRIVHRPYRSRGDECCRSRRLFVGKYHAERCSILPSGASGKFHANRYIELKGLDQTAEGFGPGGRAWEMEPSTKWSINMEGALLRHGPSVISSLRVEGWFCLHRTVRDSGLKRGGFDSAEWNLPRFRVSARMVPLWMLNLP